MESYKRQVTGVHALGKQEKLAMIWEMLLAILALLVSSLAALYASWSAGVARKANDIGRLNALLALRSRYLALIERQSKLAETLSNIPSGHQAVSDAFADLDAKLREVSHEIDTYHSKIVGKCT